MTSERGEAALRAVAKNTALRKARDLLADEEAGEVGWFGDAAELIDEIDSLLYEEPDA